MAEIVVSIDIPQGSNEVWADLSQLARHGDWMADAEQIDFISTQTTGVGTEMAVRTRVGPFVITDVIEVCEWIPGQKIGVNHRGVVSGTGTFLLNPAESDTQFVWREDLHFPWFLGGRAGAQLARPILRWIWRRNLARFAARFDEPADRDQ